MQQSIKRGIDFILALVGLILASPVLLIVAILVRMKLGSPIFFRQARVGLNGEIFEMIKFRTMKDAYDINGEPLLPELINVLKGDMSLVGPRPLLVEYLPLYSEEQMRRHNVRPGITGYAQVNGRNNISWAKKFELDIYYVNHFSLYLDIKILWQTVVKVIKQADINQEGNVTVEKFNGMN